MICYGVSAFVITHIERERSFKRISVCNGFRLCVAAAVFVTHCNYVNKSIIFAIGLIHERELGCAGTAERIIEVEHNHLPSVLKGL